MSDPIGPLTVVARFGSTRPDSRFDRIHAECASPRTREIDSQDAAAERDRCQQRVEALAQIVLGQTRSAGVSPSDAEGLVREAETIVAVREPPYGSPRSSS